MKKIKVSVIIPAYNEEAGIEKTLRSLLKQETKNGKKLDKSLFEVIVVNNASTDKTKEIVNRFKKTNTELNLFLVRESRKGIISARAKGFNYALRKNHNVETLFLASTDADVIVNPNWIEDIIKTFTKTKADFLVGDILFSKTFWQKVPYLARWFKSIKTVLSSVGNDFIFMSGGGNFAMTRETYKKINDNLYLVRGSDRVFGSNALLAKKKITYLDSPNIVSHRRFVFILNDLIEKGTYRAPMIDVRNETSVERQMKIIDKLALQGKLNTTKYIKNFIKDYIFVLVVLDPSLLVKKRRYFKEVFIEIKKYLSNYSTVDYWNNLDLVLERAEHLTNNFWKKIYQNIYNNTH